MASSSGGSATKTLWFLVKGETDPMDVTLPMDANVTALKRKIRAEKPNTLATVDANLLRIFLKQGDHEALKGSEEVRNIDGVTYDTPLYVDYPDVGAASSGTGSVSDMLLTELRELKGEMESAQKRQRTDLIERFGPLPTPTSFGSLGELQRRKLENVRGDCALPDGDGDAVMLVTLCQAEFTDEYEFNLHMTSSFTALLTSNSWVLVNCERWRWLQVADRRGLHDLKPDFLLCHPAFYSKRDLVEDKLRERRGVEQDKGVEFRFGVLAKWDLRDSIVILEGKLNINDESRGQMIVYLTNLCRDRKEAVARGMLYDVAAFELLACDAWSLLERKVGRWTQRGSVDALRCFLSPLNEWPCGLDKLCAAKELAIEECGFLGSGGFGRVFTVVDNTGKKWALKVMLNDTNEILKAEFDKSQLVSVKAPGLCVVATDFWHVGNAVGMLMPLGIPFTRPTSRNQGDPLRNVFVLLRQLHEQQLVHGDARLENIVTVGDKVKFVDLMTINALPVHQSYREDLNCLFKSLADLLHPANPEEVEAYASAAANHDSAAATSALDRILARVLS